RDGLLRQHACAPLRSDPGPGQASDVRAPRRTPRAHREDLELRELCAQLVEPHGAEVERGAVERLEVERVTVARPGVVARREPDPLADLVADRLARPPEVPVDLAGHELLREAA